MKMKAEIYQSDVPNANGVIFPKEELEKAIVRYNEKEQFIVLDKYPSGSIGGIGVVIKDNIVGSVKLSMIDDKVVADINVLDTLKRMMIKETMLELQCLPVSTVIMMNNKVTNMEIRQLYLDYGIDVGNKDLFKVEVIDE